MHSLLPAAARSSSSTRAAIVAVLAGALLSLTAGLSLADEPKAGVEAAEVESGSTRRLGSGGGGAAGKANAIGTTQRGIEKSDIRRGLASPGTVEAAGPASTTPRTTGDSRGNVPGSTARAGDPVPGIGITVKQSPGCECGSPGCNCAPPPPPPASGKFKAGKALADTVKRSDPSGQGNPATTNETTREPGTR